MPKLKERYSNEVVPALQGEFQYVNPMQVPRLQKIVVNIGMGEALQNAKSLDAAIGDLTAIVGQKPMTKSSSLDRWLQAARGPDVGFPGSSVQHRLAAPT